MNTVFGDYWSSKKVDIPKFVRRVRDYYRRKIGITCFDGNGDFAFAYPSNPEEEVSTMYYIEYANA
jgi:hypothetical protein